MSLSPIVLFVYNRPKHTLQTLEALAKNELADHSTLYVFADGPKQYASVEELTNIKATRAIIKSRKWCKEIILNEKKENSGLAKSIIAGVSEVVSSYGSVIVLEDDMVTTKYFLKFMNDSLKRFETDEKVACLTGYIYPVKNLPELFFLKGADCWGWATWKRGWDLFEEDGKKLLKQLEEQNLTHAFDFNGSYPYTQMLKDQIAGINDSWAIRWYASAFLKNKLTLYPGKTLLKNIGNDGSGTHNGSNNFYDTTLEEREIKLNIVTVQEDKSALNKIAKYFKEGEIKNTVWKKNANFTKRLLMQFLPPVFSTVKRKYIKPLMKGKELAVFSGNYSSWQEAQNQTQGYDAQHILEKVKSATLGVINGEAAFERDSMLFYKMDYTWPLLANLLKIAAENNGHLSVLDFGGALGSKYFQNREFLSSCHKLEWSVVEQANYVNCGKEFIQNDELKFYETIEQINSERNPSVLLLANVIQYLPEPIPFIKKVISYNYDYILFESTAFIDGKEDRITVQNVPEFIYKASYPAWFFNEKKFLEKFVGFYELISEFDSHVTLPIILDGQQVYWKGFVLKKKK